MEQSYTSKERSDQRKEVRARRTALYEEYKLLPKGRPKKDFNIMHGRYGASVRKRKPRYSREEVNLWTDQLKRDNYLAGRKQRKDLKGLTRAGRLAYFKVQREKWTDAEREAWKESWKRKSEPWNRKRGVIEEQGNLDVKSSELENQRRYLFKMTQGSN